MPKILVVDDEPGVRKSLSILLSKEGYEVDSAPNGIDALRMIRMDDFDLIITDLRMIPITGLELLKEVKKLSSTIEVIMITAYGSVDSAVLAMKDGAFDYITKPFNTTELLVRVNHALEKRAICKRLGELEKELKSTKVFFGMIGKSKEIVKIYEIISRVAPTDSTVLITGESGTGKELVAKALHQLSARRNKHLVTVNCAALPETLLESELFGFEKGAFTGAVNTKIGLFEEADSGSIFLDEISLASLSIQAKLLRIIETGEVRHLGSTRTVKVNVRLITATNRDLSSEVTEGRFRKDLLYRLRVVEIRLPTLRQRREDIPLLIHHYFQIYKERMGRSLKDISPEAMKLLLKYPYPGNIRELENIIEHAVAISKDTVIMPDDLPSECSELNDGNSILEEFDTLTLPELEKMLILKKLKESSDNLNVVAKKLGVSRTTLWRKMKELGLNKRKVLNV